MSVRVLIGLLFFSMPFSGILHSQDIGDSGFAEPEITEFDRDHWAFQPIQEPPIPQVSDASWPLSPIDRFILSKLESHQPPISPAGDADPRTWIRRVFLNAVGIPPTVTQVNRFLHDDRPGAHERMVDSVLADPDFGVRWGQHWLDLARFAETDGFEHDRVRSTAWRYRDWVIASINSDMPYRQFVQWQIAGDLLAPENPQAEIATAFCVSGPDMPDINSLEERRHNLLNEMTSTIGEVFLSLQFGCAQCHDHKYDAISQADFYRLRAFFEDAVSLKKNQSVVRLGDTHAGTKPTTHFMIRGDWRRKGPKVSPQLPRLLTEREQAGLTRSEFATWLSSRDNPIAARSIVNRIWRHHFGHGLVETANDFGVMGSEPSHPELLEFLASRLIEGDWSLKRLHREIMTARVYRIRSYRIETVPRDQRPPGHRGLDTKLLAVFPRRRLDAEVIRDSMLAVSEQLNAEHGGPGVSPPLPKELVKTLLTKQWVTSPNQSDHHRRSVYLFARRNLRFPLFATFDRPTADRPCANRGTSTTAVQALYLMNSELTLGAARAIANSIKTAPANARLDMTFLRILGRPPNDAERQTCTEFLAQPHLDWTDLCRGLLNCNEFIYVE